jgi:hypothetical protein
MMTDPVTAGATRYQQLDIMNDCQRRVLEIHRLPAPPKHDQRGQILRDEHGNVVRDHTEILNSAIVAVRISERISKLVGTDAPARYEFDNGVKEAAEEAAARVLAMRPHLRAA